MDDLALARQLIEAADDGRYQHPARAMARATSARDFAASLDREELGHDSWLSVQSDAWAVLASAYRSVSDSHRAESALNVAMGFLDARPGRDPLRQARLAQRGSYIRCDQGRYGEALQLNADVVRLFEQQSEPQKAAAARVDRALFLRRSGRVEAAIAELASSLDILDRHAEPRSYTAAVHNLAYYLLETADSEAREAEGLRWLDLACRLHEHHPEALNMLRLRAVAALTTLRLGRIQAARQELMSLVERFAEIGATAEQALALLHLIGISLDDGDLADAQRIAGRLFPLIGRLGLDDEAHQALLRLMAAARRCELDRRAVDQATEHLERCVHG